MRGRILLVCCALTVVACSDNTIEFLGDSQFVDENDNRIVLTDMNGIDYDITHAVTHYGFAAQKFRGGAGWQRFWPFVGPRFSEPGDGDYPAPFDPMEVIGVELNGECRAYALADLDGIEIVDEVFGDAHVAVGW